MLRYIFNDKFIEKLSEKMTQVICGRMDALESNIEKELKAIRFDLKRLDQQIASNQIKSTQEYGLLKYQVQNLQKRLEPVRKPKEASSH